MIREKNRKLYEPNNEKLNFRLDELTEEQLEIYSQNYYLVSLIQSGVSPKETLRRLNQTRSERSVRDLMKRYKKYGKYGLIDKRWLRTNKAKILKDETKKIILYYFFTYPAAGPRAVWKAACETCKEKKLPQPSESTVKKYLDSLPKALQMFRNGRVGECKWRHEAYPVIRYENTQYSNHRWQADHTELAIWIRVKIKGEWKPYKVYLTAFLDAHSRSIAGYILSKKYPDAWTIALALRKAILRKKNRKWKNRGIPTVFQPDRGKDFMSRAVASTLAKMGVEFDPDPPYYPNRKGKVERFFLTLDQMLRILPGHMDAIGRSEGAASKRVHELLTLSQLNAEIERWIVEDYHQRVHSETKRKPEELWVETVRLLIPADEDLNLLILKDDQERTVKNTGITFIYNRNKNIYWAPELTFHYRQRVRIAYNPEDLESVLLYCAATGKFICEAFNMESENPRYGIDDIRLARNQFRKGLKDRITEYMEEIEIEDRRVLREKELIEIQEDLAQEEIDDNAVELFEDLEIKSLLEEFVNIQRGNEL